MTIDHFYMLLSLVGPSLVKVSHREPISPKHRLLITLRYLATGDMPFSIGLHFLVGESTVYSIIKETCEVIANVLAPIYLACPIEKQWQDIRKGFWTRRNMPNCLGAIDSKHITIKAPPNSGSLYFNYKKTFSIVLMAACDHKYEFTLVDVGSYGCESDGGIFSRSQFGQALLNEELNFPKEILKLPNSNDATPCFLVGDEAFAISPRMMRPYPGSSLNLSRRIFNYRLSRARRIIENTFGILASRWRIFQTMIAVNVNNVDRIVMAAICLHNFLMKENERNNQRNQMYCPPQLIDTEDGRANIIAGQWRQDVNNYFSSISSFTPIQATRQGHNYREILEKYFMSSAGQVPWQFEYVGRSQHGENLIPY